MTYHQWLMAMIAKQAAEYRKILDPKLAPLSSKAVATKRDNYGK